MEEWKLIDGYEGKYSISNEGRVRNNIKDTILSITKKGQVCLWKDSVLTSKHINYFMDIYWDPHPEMTWKTMEEGDGVYWISNTGLIKNKITRNFLKLCTGKGTDGKYQLKINGKSKGFSKSALIKKYWYYEWIKHLEDGEEAKPCKYDSRYFITNKGRVWSNNQKPGWMTPCLSGEYRYIVTINGKKHKVHRLVGEHFLEDFTPELRICHHNEELPLEEINCVTNLFMGTNSENMRDCQEKGRGKCKLTKNEVLEIRKEKANGVSHREIMKKYDITYATAQGITKRRTFQWL